MTTTTIQPQIGDTRIRTLFAWRPVKVGIPKQGHRWIGYDHCERIVQKWLQRVTAEEQLIRQGRKLWWRPVRFA